MMNAFIGYAFIILSLISTIPYVAAQNIGPQNYSNFNLVLLNNTLYALGSLSPSFEIWSLDMSQSFTTTTANWQSRLNVTTLSSIAAPYDYGVAFGDSAGLLYAQAGRGGSNALATDRMSMTANMDSNNIAWYFGGRSENADGSMKYYNDIYTYDSNNSFWGEVVDSVQQSLRPGYKAGHTANLVKGKLFVLGGIAATLNTTSNTFSEIVQDFSTSLVFNLSTTDCRIANVSTGKGIPPSRLEHSMAEGPDGHSLVLFGGWYQAGEERTFYNDVWVLDTCTMDWAQQTVSGTAPIGRGGHEAVRVGNYMIIMGGYTNFTSETKFTYTNELAILDMSSWTWVSQFTATPTQTIAPVLTCEFAFPSTNVGTGGNPILPLDPIVYNNSGSSEAKKLGFGISFSTVAFLAIVGAGIWYFYRRRKRTKASTPYWLPGMGNDNSNTGHELGVYPPANHSRTTDYPMFVYDPEGEKNKKKGEIALHEGEPDSRTYTASDQHDWRAKEEEIRPSDGRPLPKHSSLWNRVRGLGDSSTDHDDQAGLIKGADKQGWTRLEDYDED
ncbi:hypothetical protein BC943DRAFT_55778 [Umbelopsis sp. AD052]|nr:hypothetical protein BC943DRAFT_55778 [Umbelopsis sp. AD052]